MSKKTLFAAIGAVGGLSINAGLVYVTNLFATSQNFSVKAVVIFLIVGGFWGALFGLSLRPVTEPGSKNITRRVLPIILYDSMCFVVFLAVYFGMPYLYSENLPQRDNGFSPVFEEIAIPNWVDKSTYYQYNSYLFKDSSGIYNYYSNAGTPVLVKEADPKTFFQVNNYYFADRQSVYYFNESHTLIPIVRAETSTFKSPGILYDYANDAQHVYYQDKIVSGVDLSTLEWLQFGYFKDANQAYYQDSPIFDADSFTFKYLGGNWSKAYAKDAKHVYLNGQIIDGADPVTFVVPR